MSEFDSVTPSSSDTGATPAPSAATTSAASAAPVASATPQAAPTASPTTPDSSQGQGMVPSYRLREVRETALRQAQQQWAQKEAEFNARYAEMERKFNALAGVTPPPDPQIQNVRQQFSQLYPGLSQIEERADQILRVLEQAGEFQNQNQHYWTSYGRQVMDRLFDHASQAVGGPLNEDAKRQLHQSFVGYIQASPENAERYANDPSIVEDFWRGFTSNFIDPVRRAATATVQGRTDVAVPRDTPSGAPRLSPVPQPANLDERAKMAWAAFNQVKNQG